MTTNDMTPSGGTDKALLPHEAERNPIVFERGGEVFANSRDVAEFFGKQHGHVMRDIERLATDGCSSNFGETSREVAMPNGGTRAERSFEMDRRGFTVLSMGFTGKKALRWKLRYIDAFEAMEHQLRQPSVIDFADPKVALGFIEHLSAQVKEKDAVITEQKGRLKKLDRIEGALGSMCITDAAKTLKVNPNHLFRFMSSRSWIYKRVGNAAWIGRQAKVDAGYLEHKDHPFVGSDGYDRIATRVHVTGKGLVKLAELLDQPLH